MSNAAFIESSVRPSIIWDDSNPAGQPIQAQTSSVHRQNLNQPETVVSEAQSRVQQLSEAPHADELSQMFHEWPPRRELSRISVIAALKAADLPEIGSLDPTTTTGTKPQHPASRTTIAVQARDHGALLSAVDLLALQNMREVERAQATVVARRASALAPPALPTQDTTLSSKQVADILAAQPPLPALHHAPLSAQPTVGTTAGSKTVSAATASSGKPEVFADLHEKAQNVVAAVAADMEVLVADPTPLQMPEVASLLVDYTMLGRERRDSKISYGGHAGGPASAGIVQPIPADASAPLRLGKPHRPPPPRPLAAPYHAATAATNSTTTSSAGSHATLTATQGRRPSLSTGNPEPNFVRRCNTNANSDFSHTETAVQAGSSLPRMPVLRVPDWVVSRVAKVLAEHEQQRSRDLTSSYAGDA
jgi:hypothetical protein